MPRLQPHAQRVLTGTIAGGLVGALLAAGLLQHAEEASLDWRLRLRGPRPLTGQVRLVGIGDDDIASPSLGNFPFPRAVHADALTILGALGAAHVTLDMHFPDASADPGQDAKFAEALQRHRHATLGYYFEEATLSATAPGRPHFLEGQRYGLQVDRHALVRGSNPVPPFAALEATFGAENVLPDDDGRVRRVPLFFSHQGRLYPGLAMQTVLAALGVKPDQIRIEPGREVTLIDTPRGTLRIPIDRHGQYRVNFAGDLGVFRPAFQYLDLYAAAQQGDPQGPVARALKDAIVFVGVVGTGVTDIVNSPLGSIPGVAVQATIADNILGGRHLRALPGWAEVLLTLAAGALAGLLLAPARFWLGLALCTVATAGWTAATVAAARADRIFPLVPLLATAGLAAAGRGALEITAVKRDRSRITSILGRYFSKPLFRDLMSRDHGTPAPSERRELTILFADIRGFTAWTERAEPDEVTARLNEYFSVMTPLVEKHGGTLDKLIGDCIMAFFGAPAPLEDHAARAVRLAWDMQQEMRRLNAKWRREGGAALQAGIGLHTAYVTVGNFGSPSFLDYTVIGRGVNLAARIESLAPPGVILVSERTQRLIQGAARTRLFAELVVKGIAERVPVHEVLAVPGLGPPPPHPAEADWWLVEDGRRTGPFPEDGITVMRQCGRIGRDTVVEQRSGA